MLFLKKQTFTIKNRTTLRMTAFPESGRSGTPKTAKTEVRLRPEAEAQRKRKPQLMAEVSVFEFPDPDSPDQSITCLIAFCTRLINNRGRTVRIESLCKIVSVATLAAVGQRFLTVHSAVYNLFNVGRHLVSAKNYRFFRLRAFASWNCAVA